MRKHLIIIIIMAIVLVLGCTACGNNSQVEELNIQIQELEQQLDESNKTIQNLQKQVAESNQTIHDLEKKLEDLEKANSKAISEQGTPNISPSKKQDSSGDQLGSIETAIFELLKDSLYRFDNPATVRVVKFHAYRESEETYYLTLTSENFLGGNLTDIYELSEDGAYGAGYTEKQLSDMRIVLGLTSPSCDVSQINLALQQYCENMGLNQKDIDKVEIRENSNQDYAFSGIGSVSGGGTFKKYNFD